MATFDLGSNNTPGLFYLKASPSGVQSACSPAITFRGASLEIPVEIVDYGLTSNGAQIDFMRTQTQIDSNYFDGTVVYSLPEKVSGKRTFSDNSSQAMVFGDRSGC